MSSTDPRARKAYLRFGYGAPSAERLEALPGLGIPHNLCVSFSELRVPRLERSGEAGSSPSRRARSQRRESYRLPL
jgi:hypothetical protein